MGNNMRRLFETHREEILKNTSLREEEIVKLKYLHEFDRAVQCATWGYPTEGAYYRDASSADSVLAIRIPTFCIHARDDPIACDEAVPYEEIKQNPWVVMCASSGGGHLAWFEMGGGRWHAKPVSAIGAEDVSPLVVAYNTNRSIGVTGNGFPEYNAAACRL